MSEINAFGLPAHPSEFWPELVLDSDLIRTAVSNFRELVITRDKHDRPFVSFDDGFARDEEWYKSELRPHAVDLLAPSEWTRLSIGTGHILKKAISAIEDSANGIQGPNNLLNWQGRQYGPNSRDHLPLIEALHDPQAKTVVESVLFDLLNGVDTGSAFESFMATVNRKYPLIAFLCWLRDDDLFMPISPGGFDEAFHILGIPHVTSGRCSWENYRRYNGALGHLALRLEMELHQPLRLIDAHSFCWMLARLPKKAVAGSLQATADFLGLDAEKIACRRMAGSIRHTAKNSGKMQTVWRKRKEIEVLDDELEDVLLQKMREQGGTCRLTGLSMHLDNPDADPNLLPSADRIDSSGPYSADNLQVVCRFANFWKASSTDEEFNACWSW